MNQFRGLSLNNVQLISKQVDPFNKFLLITPLPSLYLENEVLLFPLHVNLPNRFYEDWVC